MAPFQRVYSDDQRDAVQYAWGERMLRPAARIVALAAAGELTTAAGEPVAAFHVAEQSVRDLGRRYLRRRAGLERSRAAALEPRDAIESLRRRLVAAADHELEAIERAQARRRDVKPERIRQVARAVREISALPSTDAPAPAAPPEHKRTRGGLAGKILRAGAVASPLEPVPDAPKPHELGETPAPELGETDAHETREPSHELEPSAQQLGEPVVAGLERSSSAAG